MAVVLLDYSHIRCSFYCDSESVQMFVTSVAFVRKMIDVWYSLRHFMLVLISILFLEQITFPMKRVLHTFNFLFICFSGQQNFLQS